MQIVYTKNWASGLIEWLLASKYPVNHAGHNQGSACETDDSARDVDLQMKNSACRTDQLDVR